MASRLQDVILRGVAASRPVATTVPPGTLYFSTDTTVLERSDGTNWQSYSISASGTVPPPPPDATKFLNGAATPAFASVKDTDLATTDVTGNNVSSTKHGFAPKSPADATQFLNGAATPAYAQVKDSDLSTSDITTNNVSSTKHGLAPKSPADATQFLNGAATPAFAAVKDSDLSTSDITTNNVSTTKHGFAPKLPNDATKYLDGTGAYSVPGGGGGGSGGADFTNAGHPQGVVTGVGGQTCRDTTNGILYIKRSLGSSNTGWYPIYDYGGVGEPACPTQFSWHAAHPGTTLAGDATALQGNHFNFSGYSGTTLSANRASDGYYIVATTGTASGNSAGFFDQNFSTSWFQWSLYDFDLTFKVRLPSSLSDQRLFIGLGTADPTNADTITGRCAFFRLSSVANAGQWDAIVRDNTTTNTISSIATASASTAYLLRIRFFSSGTCKFSVDNGAESSTSTNVPTDTTNPYILLMTFNVSGSGGTSRSFQLARMGCIFGSA